MQTETIRGVLVDSKCYGMMPEQNAGGDHTAPVNGTMTSIANCTTICANLDIPVALERRSHARWPPEWATRL